MIFNLMMNWIHTALKDPKMYLSGQYGSKKRLLCS